MDLNTAGPFSFVQSGTGETGPRREVPAQPLTLDLVGNDTSASNPEASRASSSEP